MSASVQGITNLTVDLSVRSVQQMTTPVQSSNGVDAPTTQLADTPHVDAHHVDVQA